MEYAEKGKIVVFHMTAATNQIMYVFIIYQYIFKAAAIHTASVRQQWFPIYILLSMCKSLMDSSVPAVPWPCSIVTMPYRDHALLWPYRDHAHTMTMQYCDHAVPWPCHTVTMPYRDHALLWPYRDHAVPWPWPTVTVPAIYWLTSQLVTFPQQISILTTSSHKRGVSHHTPSPIPPHRMGHPRLGS